MAKAKILRIYLDPRMRSDARAGRHNFITRIAQAFNGVGYRVEYLRNTQEERLKSAGRRGYSLFSMAEPFHAGALSFRRAYFYPFWSIEPTDKRWDFHVAHAEFRPEEIDPDDAADLCRRWRKRLFADFAAPTDGGFIYMPLQGKLTRHRSFQTASPLEMIKQTLKQDISRPIIATLHPGETYGPGELSALNALVDSHDRLSLKTTTMAQLLPACAYVVTQNSAVALAGYFFAKPAVLFAQVDFHHIAAIVQKIGVAESFAKMADPPPAFERYIFWFLQKMSINAGHSEAEAQILTAARRGGWSL